MGDSRPVALAPGDVFFHLQARDALRAIAVVQAQQQGVLLAQGGQRLLVAAGLVQHVHLARQPLLQGDHVRGMLEVVEPLLHQCQPGIHPPQRGLGLALQHLALRLEIG